MSAAVTPPASETPKQAIMTGLIPVGAHALVLVIAYILGHTVGAGSSGMRDLAAVVQTLLGGELLVAVGSLVAGNLLFRRGHKQRAIGLMAGWLVGLILVVAFLKLV